MLLAIEGPKGVGKTTVVTALREHLGADGRNRVLLTKEPTGQFDLTQEARLPGIRLARAIAADRALHVTEVIIPALESGKAVICDRYILSSLVFHSTDGVPAEMIWHLNEAFPLPDVNLLLMATPTIISNRREARQAPTRLESVNTPAGELDEYARYGHAMQLKGSKLQILPNETPEQLLVVLDWITCTMRKNLFI